MKIQELANKAVSALKKEYPKAQCSLKYDNPLHLLIATRLAAQCTDARVNKVTFNLFKKFNSVDDFAKAKIEDVEEYIKTCGLYRTKAKDIVNMCKMIKTKFNGTIPDTIEELIKLPGVGRKTANLILGDIFKKPAYVVDTHCIRITGLLGLHDKNIKDATKIENILRKVIKPEEASDFCHRIVMHGRAVCIARKPQCLKCCMNSFCEENNKGD